ncbi:lathosterol oxidase isoform X2 [Heptranchias perlo]|uniref:lathosterol oxidase isoform X2 n=1 Tax=Heptranchias perlo TaxID=212740 RepID=UPI00355A980A
MDIVLHFADYYFFTPYVYPTTWPEDGALRQIISLLVVTNLGAAVIYFLFGTFNYYLIFDHTLKKHPQYLPNQVQREIKYAMQSMPWISIPTVALFFAEVRGYSKLYDNIEDSPYGWFGVALSMISFLFFTDMCIYWIHRFLHHKLIYKLVYLGLYVFVNIWTVSIHDGDYRVPKILEDVINGSAHHTDHHLYFDYNYGQYFTLWDRIGGSYKHPSAFEGRGPHDYLRKLTAEGKLCGSSSTNGHTSNGKICKED